MSETIEKVRCVPLNKNVSDEYDGEYKEEALQAEYKDYVDAVYSFNEISQKKSTAEKECSDVTAVLTKQYNTTKSLKSDIAKNRRERAELYNDAIKDQEIKWAKKRADLEQRIAQGTRKITKEYNDRIDKYKNDYNEKKENFTQRCSPVKQKKKDCVKERENLEIRQKELSEFTPEYIPPASESVSELLEKHRSKHLLAPIHYQMLDEDVKEFMKKHKYIETLEDVSSEEQSLASSAWITPLKSGRIVKYVVMRDALIFAGIITALVVLLMIISKAAGVFSLCEAVSTLMVCFFFGEIFLLISRYFIVSAFFKSSDEDIKVKIVAAAMVLGMIIGCIVYLKTGKANPQSNALSIMLLLSVPSMFFMFRTAFVEYIDPEFLDKIPLINIRLKNQSRKRMYRIISKEEKGKLNAQIYLYLNHKAVVNYVNINTHNKEFAKVSNEIVVIQNTIEQLDEQLKKFRPEYFSLLKLREDYNSRIAVCNREKKQKIRMLEAERNEPKPDFEAAIPTFTKERIKKLDADNVSMTESFNQNISALKRTYTDYNSAKSNSEKAQCEYGRSFAVLKTWNNTPRPKDCGYTLKDSFCFESALGINVIKFGLTPFTFYTNVSSTDPAKYFKKTIFRCIRGIVKMNPQAMIQINIVDPVSDPSIIKGEDCFYSLCEDGIVSGISTTDEFEIRLFTSEKKYKTFKAVFNSQCFEVKEIFDSNKDKLEKGTHHDLVLANKLKDSDDEPFMYQIMMFIVPRKDDKADFAPPKEIVHAIKQGTYLDMGLVPFFFAQKDNIREDWQEIVRMCPKSCEVSARRK